MGAVSRAACETIEYYRKSILAYKLWNFSSIFNQLFSSIPQVKSYKHKTISMQQTIMKIIDDFDKKGALRIISSFVWLGCWFDQ